MSDDALDLQWREMRDDDRNYVLSTWKRSYLDVSMRHRAWLEPDQNGGMAPTARRPWTDTEHASRLVYDQGGEFQDLPRKAMFWHLYAHVIDRLFEESTVAIAWTKDLPGTVLGWIAVEDGVLHYLHVKPRWRRLGVAKWMTRDLAAMPVTYTHPPSFAGKRLIGDGWTYDPMRRFDRKAA